jgi:hypothetical protein
MTRGTVSKEKSVSQNKLTRPIRPENNPFKITSRKQYREALAIISAEMSKEQPSKPNSLHNKYIALLMYAISDYESVDWISMLPDVE